MLTWGMLQTPSTTDVPGREKNMLDRPAPWGATIIAAVWNQRIVTSSGGTGLSGNSV